MKPGKIEAAQDPRQAAPLSPAHGAQQPGVDPVLTRLDLIFRQFGADTGDDFFRAVVTAYRTQAPS